MAKQQNYWNFKIKLKTLKMKNKLNLTQNKNCNSLSEHWWKFAEIKHIFT